MNLTRRGFFGVLAAAAVSLKLQPAPRLPDLHECLGGGKRAIMDDSVRRQPRVYVINKEFLDPSLSKERFAEVLYKIEVDRTPWKRRPHVQYQPEIKGALYG